MKKRVGTIYGKPIIAGDGNLQTPNEVLYKEGGLLEKKNNSSIDLVPQRLKDIIEKANFIGRTISKEDWDFMKSVAIPAGSYIIDNYAHPRIIGRSLDVFYNKATPNSLYIAGFSEANTLVCYGYKLYDDGEYKLYNRFQYEIKIN